MNMLYLVKIKIGVAFSRLMTKTYLDVAKDKFRPIDLHRNVLAMSMHARQELDLKIGVAFSWLMTKAYLDMAKEKFRSVAEHRNVPGNEHVC
jgi:hypothetical protein